MLAGVPRRHLMRSHSVAFALARGAQAVAAKLLETFEDYPPRQRAPSFSIERAVGKLKQSLGGN
jgi:hypothetical protein